MLPGTPPLEGIDKELAFARGLFAAFPDLEIEVTRLMAIDQVVAAAWIRRGTFTGADFRDCRPTAPAWSRRLRASSRLRTA